MMYILSLQDKSPNFWYWPSHLSPITWCGVLPAFSFCIQPWSPSMVVLDVQEGWELYVRQIIWVKCWRSSIVSFTMLFLLFNSKVSDGNLASVAFGKQICRSLSLTITFRVSLSWRTCCSNPNILSCGIIYQQGQGYGMESRMAHIYIDKKTYCLNALDEVHQVEIKMI